MGTLDEAMVDLPLWLVGLLFFVALLVSAQLGRALRRRIDSADAAEQASSTDGYLLSAALALLGLLIAFTFSLALSRYDSRRMLVIAEGNEISTAWLRATLVEGAEGDALRDALRRYGDIRVSLPASEMRAAVEDQSARQQAVIWQRLRTALPKLPGPIGATLVNATTEMFDAAASRKAERRARIPSRVLDVVSLYALISAAIIGYVLGRRREQRHMTVSAILFVLLCLAFILILDLDRPWSGGITLSSQPILDARAAMN